MLLACPNCDARYDVPDNAIPENGRDVQCSNCGHAWFQLPFDAAQSEEDLQPTAPDQEAPAAAWTTPDSAPEPADFDENEVAAADQAAPPPGEAAALPPSDDVEAAVEIAEAAVVLPPVSPPPETAQDAPGPAPEASVIGLVPQPPSRADSVESPPLTGASALKAALSAGRKEADPAPIAAPPPQPVRRELDDEVLAILRDEAEREAEARRSEAQRNTNRRAEAETGLQSQPELSVPAPTPEMTAQQKRLAMLRGEDLDDDDPPPEQGRPMARRDLLPDVEEINSTLQPDEARFDPDAEVESLPDLTRGSFRTGFCLSVLALILAALAYVFSTEITAWFPALESTLQKYVLFVDNLRNWLNSLMDSATHALSDSGQQ
ncbi:hypothetical protein HOY34_03415 [Xinfangfangia sp. D13-10-4-6]|uniref:zinc-ribbon domain-containing protein n=1 Tax=Pseudogemmobacter hezensis TaxID=2737662 RepID=UPI001555CB78|nr:zinc-ribbon domain-containing protein [Pseudogemmobacter hezensis]NPD14247.1 hypothetical protein [Pseudogemmobacter hezensis]